MGRFARWFGRSEPSMAAPQAGARIAVDCVGAEYAWVKDHRCGCGGPWSVQSQALLTLPDLPSHVLVDRLNVACGACGTSHAFDFEVDTRSAAYVREKDEALRDLGLDPEDFA